MPGKHPGNTRETPGKHPGNTQETPGIKGAGLEKKTSLAILLGILNKEKEKNNAPGKHPGNNRGKVHLLMFSIKGKKFSIKSSNAVGIWWQLCKSMFQCGGTGPFLNFLDESQETTNWQLVVMSLSRAGSSHSSSWGIFSSARLGLARDLFHFSSKLKIGRKRAEFQFSVEIFFD